MNIDHWIILRDWRVVLISTNYETPSNFTSQIITGIVEHNKRNLKPCSSKVHIYFLTSIQNQFYWRLLNILPKMCLLSSTGISLFATYNFNKVTSVMQKQAITASVISWEQDTSVLNAVSSSLFFTFIIAVMLYGSLMITIDQTMLS